MRFKPHQLNKKKSLLHPRGQRQATASMDERDVYVTADRLRLCMFRQGALAATEVEAKRVQALKEGKLDKAVKDATTAREALSKELVQATSEMTNKKTALGTEEKALEAVKKVNGCRGGMLQWQQGCSSFVSVHGAAKVNGKSFRRVSLPLETTRDFASNIH